MNPKVSGARRTGRAAAVREYLAKQRDPKTARQILEAVDPEGSITHMCATLTGLFKFNSVERVGSGYGCSWRFGKGTTRATREGPATPEAKRSIAPAKPAAARRTGAAAQPPAPARQSRATKAITAASERLIPEQQSNFHPAPGTTTSAALRREAASQRIAADIAAFEARGGRIERLGTTVQLHHISPSHHD